MSIKNTKYIYKKKVDFRYDLKSLIESIIIEFEHDLFKNKSAWGLSEDTFDEFYEKVENLSIFDFFKKYVNIYATDSQYCAFIFYIVEVYTIKNIDIEYILKHVFKVLDISVDCDIYGDIDDTGRYLDTIEPSILKIDRQKFLEWLNSTYK
jgi:hypothetical protein